MFIYDKKNKKICKFSKILLKQEKCIDNLVKTRYNITITQFIDGYNKTSLLKYYVLEAYVVLNCCGDYIITHFVKPVNDIVLFFRTFAKQII